MPATLRYGIDSSVRLDFPDGVLLAECAAPQARPLDDPAGATSRALAEPLNYPPLARSTTPGDRVVLPLDRGVPQAGEIVGAAVCSLLEAGVQPDGVTVLRTRADAEAGIGDPRPWLTRESIERITLATHEPTRRGDLAYLATTQAGEPILLNRAIIDADVVLPIGCVHSRWAAGYYGIHTAVFPTFSDQRTIERFRSPASLDGRGRPKRRPGKVVAEVGWLLGVTLTVQVVPGPADRILHVVAGQTAAVRRRARRLYEAAWRFAAPRRASLVVAAVEGSPAQQTWDNVGRAVAAASGLVEDGGAIAVCSDLAATPGPALRRLAASRTREQAMRSIRKERPEDALWATLLSQAMARTTVYLLSRLDPSVVEELEIAPIAEAEELARLARRSNSCILLANAPHVIASLEEGE